MESIPLGTCKCGLISKWSLYTGGLDSMYRWFACIFACICLTGPLQGKTEKDQHQHFFSIYTRDTHGSIKYGLIRVLLFKRGLRIADHYLRLLAESYINI